MIVLVFAVFLDACGDGPGEGVKATAAVGSLIDTAVVFRLRPDKLKKIVELPGELLPHLQTDLYARVQGYVKDIKADIGDWVKKGQTLAVIEAPEVNTQFTQSLASMQAAKAKLESSADHYNRLHRASQAESPGVVAPVDLVSSRNQMLADSATYEALRQQSLVYKQVSGYLYITAPFDGVITARKVDPGALVSTNTLLFTVQDNLTLRLRIAVPESYVSAAARNDSLLFNVDTYPGQQFTARLTRRTETIDPATRTELIEYSVDNTRHFLKAGGFVTAHLRLERQGPSYILPATAIATTLERRFVIRVRNGTAEWVDVRQGMTTDAGMEVFGDLKTGDTLLLKATDERKPGTGGGWKVVWQ